LIYPPWRHGIENLDFDKRRKLHDNSGIDEKAKCEFIYQEVDELKRLNLLVAQNAAAVADWGSGTITWVVRKNLTLSHPA
jgi:hypothetical protein